jgi:hypothetical protein
MAAAGSAPARPRGHAARVAPRVQPALDEEVA